jgi:hypothetical protein
MSLKVRIVVGGVAAAGAVASIALAPIAAADPGSSVGESASQAIDDLQAQGYNVQINFLNGSPRVSLDQCAVLAVHNPDRSGGSAQTFTTVYVDVQCPNHDDEGSIGVGGGIG